MNKTTKYKRRPISTGSPVSSRNNMVNPFLELMNGSEDLMIKSFRFLIKVSAHTGQVFYAALTALSRSCCATTGESHNASWEQGSVLLYRLGSSRISVNNVIECGKANGRQLWEWYGSQYSNLTALYAKFSFRWVKEIVGLKLLEIWSCMFPDKSRCS